jgi:hypothetical protein
VPDGSRIAVGGALANRQRLATAGGITFPQPLNEAGTITVVFLLTRYAPPARNAAALTIAGHSKPPQRDQPDRRPTQELDITVVARVPRLSLAKTQF